MKKIYNKPTIEISSLIESYGIMIANSELEITENIGAKEDFLAFDDYEDSFWGDDDDDDE